MSRANHNLIALLDKPGLWLVTINRKYILEGYGFFNIFSEAKI